MQMHVEEALISIKDKDYIEDPCREMDRLAQTFLDLKRWNFQETFRVSPRIIYNSEWCRVKFVWAGWEMPGGYSMSIYYGRLHAPSDDAYMLSNGMKCYCWHSIGHVLHFLDGRRPDYAAKMDYSHDLTNQFRQSELGESIRYQPEWLIRMHSVVWKHYGQHLFELFDLRRPDLWEQYRKFIKEMYAIQGLIAHIDPPQDQIC
jgi:hypothetical protein